MGSEEISPLDARDSAAAAAAAALFNREMGEGLYRREWLLEDAASRSARVWVAGSPQLTGAAVARLLGSGDGGYYRAFGPPALDLFAGTVGSFEAFAVEPEHRRHGLGGRLVAVSLEWMRERGCTWAVTLSWRSGRAYSSAGLFRRLGFTEGPTVERFYFEESLRNGWTCSVCGGPCTCAATLFTIALTR